MGEYNEYGDQISNDDKTWGMLSHLGVFIGYFIPFGHILAPLVIYFVKKDTSEFVANHSKESLNFQITLTIYLLVSGILAIIVIGLLLIPVLIVFQIIVIILASISANKGERYKYPLNIRFIK